MTGIAGIGKSRLAWEFEKYMDGLVEEVWWHRGRCLAYGEGVAYWALAEMVRMRARIGEDEASTTALPKLRAAVEQHVPDAEERAWIEPRLAHLLGLGESRRRGAAGPVRRVEALLRAAGRAGAVRAGLRGHPVGRAGLLDFVEHLLEWSRSFPIFVLALSRPEAGSSLAGSSRNATTLALEPLHGRGDGGAAGRFVPGLPAELRADILARVGRRPAVRGRDRPDAARPRPARREGDAYRPTGPIEELAVPETLHALLAARLDGLTPEERAIVADAAVLGKTFTKQGVAALAGRDEDDVEGVLRDLIRKEVLTVQADAARPSAASTPSSRTCSSASPTRRSPRPTGRRATSPLRATSRRVGGRRRSSRSSPPTTWRRIASSPTPTTPPSSRAWPGKRSPVRGSGRRRWRRPSRPPVSSRRPPSSPTIRSRRRGCASGPGSRPTAAATWRRARRELERSNELYAAAGATREAALVEAGLANAEWQLHQADQGLERLQAAYAVLVQGEADEGFAAVAAELARAQFFMGDLESAQLTVDAALEAAERLWLPETISQGLNTAGLIIAGRGRWEQGYALMERALEIALENDRTTAALRAYNNLGDMLDRRDRAEEAIEVQSAGLALARKVGARANEWRLLAEVGFMYLWLGRHDEARAAFEGIPEQGQHLGAGYAGPIYLAAIEGDVAEARRLLDATDIGRGEDADEQDRIGYLVLEAMVSNAEGRHQQALEAALPSLEARLDATSKLGWEEALVAAHALGRTDVVRDIVSRIEQMAPGHLPPTLRAHGIRFRALLGDDPDQRFLSAAAAFREYGWCARRRWSRPSTPSGSSRRGAPRRLRRSSPRRAPCSSG